MGACSNDQFATRDFLTAPFQEHVLLVFPRPSSCTAKYYLQGLTRPVLHQALYAQ